jgi:hypothetical protein
LGNLDKVVSRVPHLDWDASQKIGGDTIIHVSVYVDKNGLGKDEAGSPGDTGDESSITVYLLLSQQLRMAEHEDSKILKIRLSQEVSEKISFPVKIESTDDRLPGVITAFFFYQGYPCGRIRRFVQIGTDGMAPASNDDGGGDPISFTILHDGPDLTITVIRTDEGRSPRYQCFVIAPKQPDNQDSVVQDWPLRIDANKFLRTKFAEYSNDADSIDARGALNVGGKALFEIAPQVFKDVLWKLVGQKTPINSILLFTEEPDVPWELMIPHHGGKTLDALGVMSAFGRWTGGHYDEPLPLPSRYLRVGSSVVWAPVYSPPLLSSATERDFLKDNMSGTRVMPATFNDLCAELMTTNATLLHLVCHGFSDATQSGIESIKAEGPNKTYVLISSDKLLGRPEFGNFCSKRPLIFLNACNVGEAIDTLTGTGGFAPNFIQLNAGAVVAPLWSVFDQPAENAAERFYKTLRESPEKSLAQNVQEIRSMAYKGPLIKGLATYAAYCFYGDPLAKPVFLPSH